VNWRNLFIAGLILALSPFLIRLDHAVFLYSLFGYGLCELSYIYKGRLSNWDYALIADLGLILIAGLSNFFILYNLFQYVFLALLFAEFSGSEKGSPERLISLPMLFVTGALFTLYFGGLLGVRGLSDMAVFIFYFSYFMAGAAVFFGSSMRKGHNTAHITHSIRPANRLRS